MHKLYSTELFVRLADYIHCGKYDYSKTDLENKENGKVTIICPEHGEFKQHPTNHLRGDGCILCKNKKEELLFKHLEREFPGLVIEKQKRFKWLGKQSIDFYLPEYKVGIEYQGRGHFEPVEKFDGVHGFNLQQERDKKKKELCEENGIKLMYFTFDENMKTFLGEKILHNVEELTFINE